MFHFVVSGVAISCDTAEEMLSAIKPPATKSNGSKSAGVKASWDAARKLAKKEGISTRDARAKLAKQKV
jgi:hypothetical protein